MIVVKIYFENKNYDIYFLKDQILDNVKKTIMDGLCKNTFLHIEDKNKISILTKIADIKKVEICEDNDIDKE